MASEKRSTGFNKSWVLLIVVAGVERFACKGVASNLVTYLTDVLKMSTSSAAKSVSIWSGVTSMLPLVSAILTDSYWDRYSTIMASSLLYVMGLVGLTSWALLHAWMPCSSLFVPLYLISIGQGGYNPSLQAFGADQLGIEEDLPSSEEEERADKKSSFFQWWYFGICAGSLLGNSVMSYIQDMFGWGLAFAIPTGAMATSVACFFCGTRLHVQKQFDGCDRPRKSVIQTAKVATKNITARDDDGDASELELQERPLTDEFNRSKSLDGDLSNVYEPPSVTKAILRLLPIWTVLLMFAVVFQQPATFFTKQGMMMKHNFGSRFVIPPAILQSAITISIILLMPLYDKLIVPFFRVATQNGKEINVLQRIGIGVCLSIVAMVVAAIVESKRLELVRKGPLGTQSLDYRLSIFWLLPQYILLGVSDVFTVVGMQEFFYTQVPATMRTIGIGLYLSVFGVGSFLSALLISVVELTTGSAGEAHSWFSDDIREARLDNYYWLLAFLSSISFLMFATLSKFHYYMLEEQL